MVDVLTATVPVVVIGFGVSVMPKPAYETVDDPPPPVPQPVHELTVTLLNVPLTLELPTLHEETGTSDPDTSFQNCVPSAFALSIENKLAGIRPITKSMNRIFFIRLHRCN